MRHQVGDHIILEDSRTTATPCLDRGKLVIVLANPDFGTLVLDQLDITNLRWLEETALKGLEQ